MNAPLPPRAWLVVGTLWVVAALNYLDRNMITTMRGSLTEAIPMTDAQFGLLTSVFLWVYGLLSPLAGFLADRYSRSRLIVGSLLVWSLLTWLTGIARNFEQLVAVRALMGLSEAAYLPAALALIADYHRGATRSLATGVHMTGLSVGTGLGGVGGWLAAGYGWNVPFTVFGWFGVAYAVWLAFVIRDVPRVEEAALPQPRLGEAVTHLLRSGRFLVLVAFWGLLALAGWAIVGWMPTFFKEQFGLGQGAAGISATGCLAAAMFAGKIGGGWWADRWSRTNVRARILAPAIGLLIAAPATLLVAKTGVLALALAGLAIYGMMRSVTDANLMPILCQVADSRYRATGYGILNMAACIVGGVTVYLGGAMRDARMSLGTLFAWAALGLLICAVLLATVKPAPANEPASRPAGGL